MLKELYIDNFRRFVNQRIELSETMLIIGKNGAGKTTLMELVHRLKCFIINNDNTGHVSELVTVDDLPRWLKSDHGQAHSRFEMKYDFDDLEYVYELEIQYNLRDSKQRIFSEKLTVNHETVYKSNLDDDHAGVITDDGRNFRYVLEPQRTTRSKPCFKQDTHFSSDN